MIDVEKTKSRYFYISIGVAILGFVLSGVVASIDGSSIFRFFFITISLISIYQYLFVRLKLYMDITKRHIEVDSTIQEMQVSVNDNDKVKFSMITKYEYNGAQYINKLKVTNYEFDEFKPGDHIGVYIDPKNPKNAEIRVMDLPGYGCLSILVVSFLIVVVYPIIRLIVTNI